MPSGVSNFHFVARTKDSVAFTTVIASIIHQNDGVVFCGIVHNANPVVSDRSGGIHHCISMTERVHDSAPAFLQDLDASRQRWCGCVVQHRLYENDRHWPRRISGETSDGALTRACSD